ncbi:MAG: exodeoxyribonuclease VII large subunit [Woeseia sp.]|nr:exodeoxyribonuclease VII large subunit [Woeseia sp.]MBT8095973.1 exodeoxyribonuclease VII large subunit [Woeseia sp.]NNE60017.1 exodeoxyribonuclease VII large subunit [Woeseia sp.]NNL55592.1 exodeoxyribonuclease VII large subunit [Woeseia sp.]
MKDSTVTAQSADAITVSELNRQAKTLLERGLARVWVEGELSNLARPASGHVYFTLKDKSAQVRCAFFRQRQRGPTLGLSDGDQMLALGRVSLYEARGDYQLIIERLEPAGEGELRRRFELLKRKLAAEGLFDEDLKRPLPAVPRRIGVITSPSGAAIRDVLTVLQRRFPVVPVTIYPSAVQGDAAPGELLRALQAAVRRAECDVLILCRGGGSLEDLWAFNDEALARAIRQSPIPVISAVGHEVDFTIADFVADLRAPTPSGAAELVVPDRIEWLRGLANLTGTLSSLMRRQLEEEAQTLDWLAKRLAQSSPITTVARQAERMKNSRIRLAIAIRHAVAATNHRAVQLNARLLRQSPAMQLERDGWQFRDLRARLGSAGHKLIDNLQQRLKLNARALNAVSPLATLERGYAIVSVAESNNVLTDTRKVQVGSAVRARLARGSLIATVDHIERKDD